MRDDNETADTINAVAELAKVVPIYQDAVQPAARQIGKALETVAKTVHVALAPVSALVWGYDQIKDFVSTKMAERLNNVPPQNIITPKPNVAGPALEALRYTGHEEELSELYANLLASSMDRDTAEKAHPAFVEIIKQLTPDEAKIIGLFLKKAPRPIINVGWKYKKGIQGKTGGQDILKNHSHLGTLAKCQYPDLTPTYIDNLCRLGLAAVPIFDSYTAQGVYDALENDSAVMQIKQQLENDPERDITISRVMLKVTELGKQFAHICAQRKS